MEHSSHTQHISALWTRAQPAVASYINALVPDFHAAEDILQAVAVLVVKKFDKYDPSLPFLGWALGIARYEVMHYRRSKAREKLMFSGEIIELLSDSFEDQEQHSKDIRRAVAQCLERLSGRSRELFQMRYSQEISVNDMADRMEMKPNAVSVTLLKCRQALRKCLSTKLGDGLWR